MSAGPDSLWMNESDDRWNRPARRAPAYLTPEQAQRWQRITHARMLFRGEHYRYYVEQGRTMYEFPRVVVDGEERRHYVEYNLLKRISHTSADLLFGSEPLVRIDDQIQGQKFKDFAARTDLHALLVEMEVECSFAAEALVEVCIFDGETYLVLVPAEQIHPIGELRPDRQYAAYVRYAEANVGTEQTPIKLILQTTYREGSIERHLFQEEVDPKREVDLNAWPAFKDSPKQPIDRTGIPFNTIVWFPNLMLGGRVVSDYDGLIALQDTLNAKQTQFARVIARHSNPKIIAPREAADENGDLRAASDVLYADSSDGWKYLSWDAQLEMAYKDREHAIDAMCVVSETSPVLLGIDKGGAPESARAMRLRASSSTAKAQRKATLRRPLLSWLFKLVQMLDQTIQGNRYDLKADPTVEVRDGLPTDESELVDTVAAGVTGKVMSIERAVSLQISDPQAQAEEVARIKAQMAADAAAATPSFLNGEPSADQPGSTDTTLNGAQITAVTNVLSQLRAGSVGQVAAVELLTEVGIDRERAQTIVSDSLRSRPSTQTQNAADDTSTEAA